ncbi:MAG: hypothetical protein V7L26_14795 [Nostoc sp.]|uniref:hypothetical protein n=1 Tax=Nostoc sp. TaxID=1180 RepID=UPI002FF2D116
MRNKTRYRNSRKPRPSEERDYLLIGLLAIFNLVSAYTTIKGVKILLDNSTLAVSLGGFIQLVLFLTLSGFMLKKAHLPKWIAVIVFTFISVYTSFFTYYTNLSSKTNTELAHNKAEEAHNKLVADVYTPMQEKLRQLQQEANTLQRKANEEAGIGLTTGLIGRGPIAKNFEEKTLEKEGEAKQFERTFNELTPKFNYDLKEFEPKEIMKKDRQALAATPKVFRNNYKEKDLDRSTYINPEDDISLFAPYLKLKSQDVNQKRPAILSLLMASLIDGMSILLGAATTFNPYRRSRIVIVGQAIARLITNIKRSSAEITQAFKQSGAALTETPPEADTELDDTVEMLTLRLRGRGSEFLQSFYGAINETAPHEINRSLFESHSEQSYRNSFRDLTDQFRDPKLKWIEIHDKKWQVQEEYYHRMVRWLKTEIKRLYQEESQNAFNYDYENLFQTKNVTPLEVQVRMPSNINGHHN